MNLRRMTHEPLLTERGKSINTILIDNILFEFKDEIKSDRCDGCHFMTTDDDCTLMDSGAFRALPCDEGNREDKTNKILVKVK